ncbi:PAS domain S-box protein [Geomesophilobacter sediminis]|uniref:histidine kinase n=1 Tax=Geomesophilobacter sediminis TaxID=2798584 RepID=A0A8J7IZH9_9BACT|nr:PAS domain S-box protein [Geomesophilobacter sediminis]MBJ6725477.1 PAS domain S-box protein [Geomesophilobacter sediminis]
MQNTIAKAQVAGIETIGDVAGELEENRERLAAVFATAQVGIFIVDAETHVIVDANPKALELIGHPRERVVGELCRRFVCPDDPEPCPIIDLGQTLDNAERKLLNARGECVPIVKTVARATLRGRLHLVESFVDISRLKSVEKSLRESQEQYRDLLENANDLIQSVAPDGRYLYVNRAWKETLGYSDAEVVKLKVFDVISEGCRNRCSLMFQRILSGENIPRVEVQFVAKDGRIVDLEGSINCCVVDGEPQVTRGIFRDITERKTMERELQQSEERYRKLVENAPEAILVQSEGTYRYANTQALKLFRAGTPEDLIGVEVLSLIHPDYREQVAQRIRTVLETSCASPLLEQKILCCDGTVLDVEASGTSITFHGKPATQVIIRDITERKRVEAERREWNLKLEKKVEEKTRHLKEAQAKLIQSEKMTTLAEVIAGASHELNNPIAGILGAIQMLRGSALAQPIVPSLMEEVDVLESMESAARRCQKVVEDLSRFTTQTRCNFTPTDVNQVLKDTLEIMGEQYREMGVQVQWKIEPELPPVEADFVKLLEVFVNLLQNAKNALAEGGEIEIATRKLKKYADIPRIAIEIRDNGCGIPAHNLGKIFDPFFTTKPAGKGPGLGLTVSYGIIKRHHGEIDVRSTVGKGTRVTVTLPVRQPVSVNQ